MLDKTLCTTIAVAGCCHRFSLLTPPSGPHRCVQCIKHHGDAGLMLAEEEKAAAEAEAAVAAREATPEVSEEGEIPVDPEEMEVLSKAQQPAPKAPQLQSPSNRHNNDRARERASDRDRGPAGRDRQAHSHTLKHCHYSHSQCTACLVSCHLHGCLVNAAGNGFSPLVRIGSSVVSVSMEHVAETHLQGTGFTVLSACRSVIEKFPSMTAEVCFRHC